MCEYICTNMQDNYLQRTSWAMDVFYSGDLGGRLLSQFIFCKHVIPFETKLNNP